MLYGGSRKLEPKLEKLGRVEDREEAQGGSLEVTSLEVFLGALSRDSSFG